MQRAYLPAAGYSVRGSRSNWRIVLRAGVPIDAEDVLMHLSVVWSKLRL